MSRFADVVFPRRLIQSFTYLVPDGFPDLAPGVRVQAPFGRASAAGFVIGVHDRPPAETVHLKELTSVIDRAPLIELRIIEFTRRLSEFHLSPWGEMLAASLPPPAPAPAKRPRRAKTELSRAASLSPQLDLDFASTTAVQAAGEMVIAAMAAMAADAVTASPAADGFGAFCVQGGLEERRALYRDAIRAARLRDRSVLLLVPEVDEIEPMAEWAADTTGFPATAVHGRMSERAKRGAWAAVAEGRAGIVVGSRAALFWPIRNLGLIIVEDEPHEAYLPIESPAFDVRRAARIRAEVEGAVVLFGSDIPSVAAREAARSEGRLLEIGGGPEPRAVSIADDSAGRAPVAAALADGLRTSLGSKGRAVVFLNRRGYASLLFCPRCGFIPSCRRCGGRPAYHKSEDRLVCHACGAAAARPAACPRCGGRILEPRGIGIEALEEEIRRLFPRARVARFDRDSTARASDRKKVLDRFAAGRIDILLGTELLARQAGLPPFDFVGIVNPEARLAVPDFLASERAFQGVCRMLRFVKPAAAGGKAVIQTGFPDHFSLRTAASGDYGAFFTTELESRRLLRHPPFSAMAEIVLRGRDSRSLGRKARALAEGFGARRRDVEVLGPAMASNPGGRGLKTIQILLRAAEEKTLTELLGGGLKEIVGLWSVSRFP